MRACCGATIASIRDLAKPNQRNTAELSEDVENNCWVFLSWATFFLFVAGKKKECRKLKNKHDFKINTSKYIFMRIKQKSFFTIFYCRYKEVHSL